METLVARFCIFYYGDRTELSQTLQIMRKISS